MAESWPLTLMLCRRTITAHELIYHADQSVQALVGVGLRGGEFIHTLGKPVHSLDQAKFSLSEPVYEVGEGSDRCLNFGKAFIIIAESFQQSAPVAEQPGWPKADGDC